MSLDIDLVDDWTPPEPSKPCICSTCMNEHQATPYRDPLFEANITHNLGGMANEGGFYRALWRPEEETPPVERAHQLEPFIARGLEAMRAEPDRFKRHNPSNGWGSYEVFLPWLERLLEACREYPNAKIEVSR